MEETKKRKGSIREEDVLLLLNRYSPTAILNLLKEVAQFGGVKIDWNALVMRSATGISSAREYQMLWRHLAYRDPLSEKIDADAEPLEDDSDLEFELEPFPAVSGETSAEAAACVKILVSSGLPNETVTNRSTADVQLPTNAPNGSCTASDKQMARSNRGTNSAVPLSIQKQPQAAAAPTEVTDGTGSAGAGGPAKKKRKLWTKEEDMELIAAVDKCGEGNWANILKGDFKHDRTASQLSQRWSIIRKRRASLTAGNACSPASPAPTEAHMATWQAVNMAIKMPIIGGLSARRPGSTGALPSTEAVNPSSAPALASESAAPEVPNQSHPTINQTTLQKGGNPNPLTKSRTNSKVSTVPAKHLGGPSSIIQAAAFAAGGRIANPSTAASHFKAAQSKNAVHIRHGGALSSSAVPGSKSLSSVSTSGPQNSNARSIKTPVSPKDMPTVGPRAGSHQGVNGSSDEHQLSPSSTMLSTQTTEQAEAKPSATSLFPKGSGESTTAGAVLDTSGRPAEDENKGREEDSPLSPGHVDLSNLDVDSGADPVDDEGAAADGQTSGEAEPVLRKSDSPCMDSSEKPVAEIDTPGCPVTVAPELMLGETTGDEVSEHQIHAQEAGDVAAEETNKKFEDNTLQSPAPEANGG